MNANTRQHHDETPRHDIQADVVRVTPAMAQEFLKANTSNRPLRKDYVAELASTMRRGEWSLNGETIKFAKNGRLLDGQHRLSAIIESRVPIDIMVVRNVDDGAFATIDMNRKRTAADALAIAGYPNEKLVAASVRLILLLSDNKPNARVVYSHTQIKEWCDAYFEELSRFIPLGRMVAKSNMCESSIVVALCYFFNQKDPSATNTFFSRVADGVGLRNGSPIAALRSRLTTNATSPAKLPRVDVVALIIKSWNAYREDRDIDVIAWRSDEGFPSIR